MNSRSLNYFSLTAGGALMALKLRDRFGGTAHLPRCHTLGCKRCDPFDSISEALPQSFKAGETVVCVMAAGIVFRVLAPHLGAKHEDPAVIVIDEEGRHVVPLLGGHAAGSNNLAREIAAFLGGDAVITTSSDVQGLTGPDEVARMLGASAADQDELRRVTSLLVDGRPICIEAPGDPGIAGYEWVPPGGDTTGFAGRLLISYAAAAPSPRQEPEAAASIPTARLIPRCLAAGIGCRRGADAEAILAAIESVCREAGIDPRAIGTLASIDLKHDEPGLLEAAKRLGAGVSFYPAAELRALDRPGSSFVEERVGSPAVSEPAALLAAGSGATLLVKKTAAGPVTVALAAPAAPVRQRSPAAPGANGQGGEPLPPAEEKGPGGGCVLVIGTGAGTGPLLTEEAREAIGQADVVLGYRTYIEQMRRLFPHKNYISGSMGAEIDRCRQAVELAASGRTVALVSSGDPGVYGMAGPLLELAGDVPVRVIPGVTAAQIAAARLGAPLMNDYITLSLSDLLTPREEVIRRARVAAASGMVVCFYNPTSKKRRPLFEEVCAVMLEHRPAETPAGWVQSAGSPDEKVYLGTLGELLNAPVDMRTVIIIGNSRTEVTGGRMVTRRGYERKAPAAGI